RFRRPRSCINFRAPRTTPEFRLRWNRLRSRFWQSPRAVIPDSACEVGGPRLWPRFRSRPVSLLPRDRKSGSYLLSEKLSSSRIELLSHPERIRFSTSAALDPAESRPSGARRASPASVREPVPNDSGSRHHRHRWKSPLGCRRASWLGLDRAQLIGNACMRPGETSGILPSPDPHGLSNDFTTAGRRIPESGSEIHRLKTHAGG